MLRGIAVFSMQGRWQAAIAISLFSLASLILPPLNYLASGVIALSTLRMGPQEGAKIGAASLVIFTLFTGLVLDQFYLSGLFLLSSWLPVFGISLVLGYTRSLSAALLVAGGLGIVLVLGAHLLVADLALWWQKMIELVMASFVNTPNWQLNEADTQLLFVSFSEIMTGFIAAGFSLHLILGLLLGRAWQAKLYNEGGFASEFYQFNLGRPAAILTVVVMVLALSPLGESWLLLKDCLAVVVVVFTLQGLSVVHSIVNRQQKHKFWLFAMYVLLLVMMPQMLLLLAMIGVLEQWFNFRHLS